MGNKPSHVANKQVQTRPVLQNAKKSKSLSTIPLSFGAVSLSCLAAEHNQIHNQESLDNWRTKALHTIDELYDEKSTCFKQEANVQALLDQLKATIDKDKLHKKSGYLMDDHSVLYGQIKISNGY